jgi:homoserine kinase
MKTIAVLVPASSANLGPGFDILGVALSLYNEVRFSGDAWSTSPTKDLCLEIQGAGVIDLASDATNLVIQAAYAVFRKAKRWPKHLDAQLINRIPLSRGLGSSSAAIVGGLVAANHLLGNTFSYDVLLEMAVAMEGHPDNVTPALLGGFCVSGMFEGKPRHWIIPAATNLKAVVAVPELPLPTKAARAVLPKQVSMKDAVFTASRVAFLLGALVQKRYDGLGSSMEDVLHQPYRKRLIPGLMEVIAAARKAGAYGAALSGAGSCVIAFTPAGAVQKRVGLAMQAAFRKHGVTSQALHLNLENKGVRVS